MSTLHAWIDASGGVAGDMLLGALLDAGARLPAVQQVVEAVLPETVTLETRTVQRAGMRATKLDVRTLVADHPHRTWRTIRTRLEEADIPAEVRARSLATFARLAEAEGRVHGVAADEVHFHEVGAIDSIIDIVGSAVGLDLLGVDRFEASPVPPGRGTVSAAHGRMALPAPATAEILKGTPMAESTLDMEMTTPTGASIVTTVAERFGPLPALTVETIGLGAGTRDTPKQANILRLFVGTVETPASSDRSS